LQRARSLGNTDPAMPAHLSRPSRRGARALAILGAAAGVSLLVVVALSLGDADDADVAQDDTDASTGPTVLGEQIESTTTLEEAPPASAVEVTTPTAGDGAPLDEGDDTGDSGSNPTTTAAPSTTTSPTIGPPTSITRPPPRSTTTTAPTTTTEPTTTTSTTTSTVP
jgi:hypothetical protein